jgi:class 3 adenylate cyclase/TolB-like protein/Flp pilus assembly protein TadD
MGETDTRRKLAAILCADVVGYSRLMGEDEEATLRDLRACREAIIRSVAARHGRVFGGAGDSAVAEFASPVEAVRCALDIQEEAERQNAARQENRRMRLRIGVHLGDVLVEGDDLLGEGVNVAARLEALAEPGAVLVSRAVRDQVRDRLPVVLEDLGERALKNIARPVRVYRARPGATPAARVEPPGRGPWPRRALLALLLMLLVLGAAIWLLHAPILPSPSGPGQTHPVRGPSIAVLPFANLSGDRGQDYFADGITRDVTAALGRFPDLSVIAPDAAAAARKDGTGGPREIARELGVGYLLEGSVRRDGDRVRVTAQLLDAGRGVQLWSERFDTGSGNVLAAQDEIAERVAGTLGLALDRLERERALAKPAGDLDAYDLVLRGWDRLGRGTRTANDEARGLFARAAERDPGLSGAWLGQGFARYQAVTRGWTEFAEEELGEAEAFARKALEVSPYRAGAHDLLGFIHLYRRDYDRALAELDRALELNPSDYDSHFTRAAILTWSGRPAEALASLERAQQLHPVKTDDVLTGIARARYLLGDYEGALKAFEGVHPGDMFARDWATMAAAYAQLGRTEDAARTVGVLREKAPLFEVEEFADQFRDPASRARVIEGLRKAGLQ